MCGPVSVAGNRYRLCTAAPEAQHQATARPIRSSIAQHSPAMQHMYRTLLLCALCAGLHVCTAARDPSDGPFSAIDAGKGATGFVLVRHRLQAHSQRLFPLLLGAAMPTPQMLTTSWLPVQGSGPLRQHQQPALLLPQRLPLPPRPCRRAPSLAE